MPLKDTNERADRMKVKILCFLIDRIQAKGHHCLLLCYLKTHNLSSIQVSC